MRVFLPLQLIYTINIILSSTSSFRWANTILSNSIRKHLLQYILSFSYFEQNNISASQTQKFLFFKIYIAINLIKFQQMNRQHQTPQKKNRFSKPEGKHKGFGHRPHNYWKRPDQQRLCRKGETSQRQCLQDKPWKKQDLPPCSGLIGEGKRERWGQGYGRRGHHKQHMQAQSQSTLPQLQPNQPQFIKRRRRHHWRFAKYDFQAMHPFDFQHFSKTYRSHMHQHRWHQTHLAAYQIDSFGENFPKDSEDKVTGNIEIDSNFLIDDFRENLSQKSYGCAPSIDLIRDFIGALRECSFLYQKDIQQDELEEKVKQCICFMFYLAIQRYQDFRKFIHEKIINLLNTNTFNHPSHQNPYIIMNNSLKNSAKLKTIMQAYFIKNQTQTKKQERRKYLNQTVESIQSNFAQMDYYRGKEDFIDQEFSKFLLKGEYIRYKSFEQNLQSQIPWLVEKCTYLFEQQKSKEKDSSSVDFFTNTVNHILYGDTISHHINDLVHLAQCDPDKNDHMVADNFADTAYKIMLVCSLRQCLKMCFEDERPISKQLQFDSKQARKAMYYSVNIAFYSNIPQFQEISFDKKIKDIDFCAPSSVLFFDNDCQPEQQDNLNQSIKEMLEDGVIQSSFFCHYFIQMMSFLKNTITQGITVKLTKNNLIVSNSNRMKFALQQPFLVVKTHKQLEAINPELSKILKMIQQKVQQTSELLICSAEDRLKQISQHIETHVNNLNMALRVLKLILQNFQSEEDSQIIKEIIKEFELNCNYQEDNFQKIKAVHDGLLQSFKSIKDPLQEQLQQESVFPQIKVKQSFQVASNQKDAFKLMQAILIMKILIITYKFYRLIDKDVTYRKFLSIKQQITSNKNTLSTIYYNLFSQKFLDQDIPKTQEQEYNSNLMKLLNILHLINKQQTVFTGIHGVSQLKTTKYGVASQFTTTFIDDQKTVIFGSLPRELARQLLLKVCMPIQNSKLSQKMKNIMLTKNEVENQQVLKEERQQFTLIQATQVIKTLLTRIKKAFNKATQLDIRVPLFLLRHFMIDNRITKQNFPNPFPCLNILQAFMDTNIRTNLYNPNFVEEYYLNRTIKKFFSKLPTKSHNQFIEAIFLLSLITEKTELQYLKNVHFFLKDKLFKQIITEQINISQFYSKMTLSTSEKQIFWYLQTINQKDMHKLLVSNIRKFSEFFYVEGIYEPLHEEQIQEYGQLCLRRREMFINLRMSNQQIYYIRKYYNLVKCQFYKNQLQATMIRQLLLLQYKNMKYLHTLQYEEQSLIKNIVAILPFYSNKRRMFSYQVIIKTQANFLQPRNKYIKYFGIQSAEKWIIERKSGLYYSLTQLQRKAFIDNLLMIVIQAREKRINLFNIDIITIKIVPNEDFSIYRKQFFYQQWQNYKFTPYSSKPLKIKPIFDEISVCRVYDISLARQNYRVYQQYSQIFGNYRFFSQQLSFNHHLNVFTIPSYFQRARLNQTGSNDQNAEDIGNIGLTICSLFFHQHHYYSKYQNQNKSFLKYYRKWIEWLTPYYYVIDDNDDIVEGRIQSTQDLVRRLKMLICEQPKNIGPLTDNDQQFLPFLLKLIHPIYDNRTTVDDVQAYLNRSDLIL